MLTKIWNDFCDDVLTSKKKKSKEKDFEKGPVKDFLTSLGWVKYGGHRLVEQHPIQFATANHYADFALFLQNEEKPEMIIELKRPTNRKKDKDTTQLEDYMVKEECSFGLLVGEVLEFYFIDFSKSKHHAELITTINFDKNNDDAKQLITLLLSQDYDTERMREHCLQQLKLNDAVRYWNSQEGRDNLFTYILESSSLPKSLKNRLQSMMSIDISVKALKEDKRHCVADVFSKGDVLRPIDSETKPSSIPSQEDNFKDSCIKRIVQSTGSKLVKKSGSTYWSSDGKTGYVIRTSKIYKQGDREKYWYSYKRMRDLANCINQFCVFGCNDANTIIVLPVSEIESQLDAMNYSSDSNGTPLYWHIVFFKDAKGKMTWLLSKPKLHEVDITNKLL